MPCLVSSGHGFALIACRIFGTSEEVRRVFHLLGQNCAPRSERRSTVCRRALGAVSLAACAQSSVVVNKSEFVAANQEASLEHQRGTSFVMNRRVAVAKKRTLFASNKTGAERQIVSNGLASFYTEGAKTASGERFDTHELTAAHATLPFGTRLRVTNVATGRSVTVRVNNRCPFVSGRVVDVSYAAAETPGMIGGGIAKG
jgi:rare lipoprotein A